MLAFCNSYERNVATDLYCWMPMLSSRIWVRKKGGGGVALTEEREVRGSGGEKEILGEDNDDL